MRRLVATLVVFLPLYANAQCPPGPLGTGNFLDKPSGCATNGLDINFTPIYSQLDDNAEIHINWDDGTAETVINVGSTGVQSGITYNTPVPHTYSEANTTGECVYTITSYVVSSCYTQEETTVENDIIIWNTDNYGDNGSDITIEPMLYEVCAGTSATVSFTDVSPWNCTDVALTIGSLNELERWTQWEYGVFNDITGTVLIDGNDESPYPFPGTVFEHSVTPVLDPQAPGNQSLEVFVPNSALVGEEFHIRLNNWNQCNPYEDNSGVPTGNAPVTQDAIIRIIEPPSVDVETVVSGPFCIGETVDFSYLGTTDPSFSYLWDFGDGNSSTQQNPSHTYTSEGTYDVTVTVTNNDAGVECSVVTNPPYQVTISPTPVPVMFIADTNNQEVDLSFCSSEVINLKFGVDSANSSFPNIDNTSFTWTFYQPNSTSIIQETISDPTDTIEMSYNLTGTYLFTLEASDNSTGCSFLTSDTLFIYDNPNSEFEWTEVCEGSRTQFYNISDSLDINQLVNGDYIVYWDWDFSYDGTFNQELRRTDSDDFEWNLDGNDVTGEQESTASISGEYSIALRTITALGYCETISVQDVVVNPSPISTFDLDNYGPLCPGEVVTILNTSVQPEEIQLAGETTYHFVIDDQSASLVDTLNFLGEEFQYEFQNDSDSVIYFNLQLIATSPQGCITISDIVNVAVNPASDSFFSDASYDPLGSNCSIWQSTIQVDNATLNSDPDSILWTIENASGIINGYPITQVRTDFDFGTLDYSLINDGNTIINFQVTLQPYKNNICYNSHQEVLRISPTPSSEFTVIEIDSCDFKLINVEASQSGLSDYQWTYNPEPDLVTNEFNEIQLTYNRPALGENELDVTIQLTTENLVGCSNSSDFETSVLPLEVPLIAQFELNVDTVYFPDNSFQITNNSSGAILNYFWDFGNGETSSNSDPIEVSYNEPGEYDITLTVSNSFCSESFSSTVYVIPSFPIVDFEATNISGCRPLIVNFTNLSQFTESNSYVWDFGDGIGTSTQENPSYTYFEAGEYTVTLTGQNILGDEDAETKEFLISVYELPVARFEVRPEVIYIPDDPAFFGNFSVGADSYQWDFGDGNTSTDVQPIHFYQEIGNYEVTLIATTNEGCSDTTTVESAVLAEIGGETISPNAFTPNTSGPTGGQVSGENGVNDVFLPVTESVVEFNMFIYNRWGELLFQSRDKTIGWDGYFNGEICPPDVYVYKLELAYADGSAEIKVGDLTLIR